jgi:hypothetical protein
MKEFLIGLAIVVVALAAFTGIIVYALHAYRAGLSEAPHPIASSRPDYYADAATAERRAWLQRVQLRRAKSQREN